MYQYKTYPYILEVSSSSPCDHYAGYEVERCQDLRKSSLVPLCPSVSSHRLSPAGPWLT